MKQEKCISKVNFDCTLATFSVSFYFAAHLILIYFNIVRKIFLFGMKYVLKIAILHDKYKLL